MKKLLLTLLLIVIFIVLSGCIQEKTIKITETQKQKDNYSEYYYKGVGNVSSCQFNHPSEKTIIIRLDDVGYFDNKITIDLIDTTLNKDISITLAVVPKNISNDTIIKNYLISKVKDSRVEIAQHGTNHDSFEYQKLNRSDTYNLAKLGLEKIVGTLNIYPMTFIPPYNGYDRNTTVALSELGFKVLSAREGDYKFDGNMMLIGYTSRTREPGGKELIPINKILEYCEKSLYEKNICIILIHPQDYTKEDGKTLDKNRYEEFVKLLDILSGMNVKFSTFKELLKCNDN